MQARYETGMRIVYDAVTKRATVAFRGRLLTLSGLFARQEDAIKAGEDFCRRQGWADRPIAIEPRSLLRHRTARIF